MSDKSNATNLSLGGEPRANLLPPEVVERGKVRATRRLMVILVVIAIGVVIAGYAVAALRAVGEQAALDAATTKTGQILAEKQKYQSASAISAQVTAIQAALKQSAATEVLWSTQYQAIKKLLPQGAVIVQGTFSAPAPTEAGIAVAGPLRNSDPIATLGFSVNGISVPQAVDLLPRLNALPGFGDATIDDVKTEKGVWGAKFTLNLTSKAFSGRFGNGS
jgi:hypothetical protein